MIPALIANGKRIPNLIKNGLATFTLFDNLPYSIGVVLEANAIKYRDRPAILFEEQSYTYGELNALVNQMAHFFLSVGVKRGNVVILYLENRPETLIITCALAKIGAVASLINAQQQGEILLHSITVKQNGFFVIGEELIEPFEAIRKKIPGDKQIVFGVDDAGKTTYPANYISLYETIASFPKSNLPQTKDIRAKEPFAFIFTSGTTGMPKASIQTHKRWLSAMNWFGKINGDFKETDVIYVSIPFFHANALIIAWSSAFSGGAALAIRRKFSVSAFWEDIQKYRATAFVYIGEICRYLLNAPLSSLDQSHKVTKIIGNGMRPDVWQEFKKRFNISTIYEFYSASESNIVFTNTLNLDYTVGWSPVTFALIRYDIDREAPILDKKGKFQKVKVGEVGLMISKITAAYPFSGYVNADNNNDKVFKNVFEKGDQWFNTGDLMRDIGFKHTQFVDRVGDTFRWKGENVATAEVESIINQLDMVENCAVYGVSVPNCDGRAGMCTIIPKIAPEEMDGGQLYQTLSNQLPPYAVPLFVRFSNTLATTATQKLQKATLKKEGFECSDVLWCKLPGTKAYVPLDEVLLEQIKSGQFSF